MGVMNLDVEAARAARAMTGALAGHTKEKEPLENVATKALGVVQEAGVYSGMLFLLTRGEKEKPAATAVRRALLELAKKIQPTETNGVAADGGLKYIAEEVGGDLDTLLLVKQAWEQALVYCRYGAKAME